MSDLKAVEVLERTIAIIPWVADHEGGWASYDAIAERFAMDRDDAYRCMELASMVGVAPYTPDTMIEIIIETDGVAVSLPDFFRRPLRPSPEQTFLLLTAAKVFTSIEGASASGALRSALTKVTAALDGETVPVEVAIDDSPVGTLEVVRSAIASGRVVEFDHFSYGRDVIGHRTVDPWRVQQVDGHWYLQGWCHDRRAERIFRLDRVTSAAVTDRRSDPPDPLPEFRVFSPDDAEGMVRLRLAPAAAWVLEYYPYEAVARDRDGSIEVTLAVGSTPWLERLLLRLGGDAAIVDAPDGLRTCGRDAARRLLERYRK